MNLNIIYLDNHLLTVFKPAGMLSQGDETGDKDLLTLCKEYIAHRFDKPGNVFLGLTHRLDRPVSGLIVFARTSKAASRLSAQFKQRSVAKNYLAIVEGVLEGEGEWQDHLLKDGRRVRVVAPDHPHGKLARLAWRGLGSHAGASLVSIQLFTGRPHQIRLQFASRGYPLLGDFRYGARRSFDDANLALHAYRLGIVHPIKKERLYWTAPPPASWDAWFVSERKALLESGPD